MSEPNLYTLAYESKELHDFSSDEMKELLLSSRSSNKENGITGCLIYYLGRFVQILEGDEDSVKQLFQNIENDKRHQEVHLFSEDYIRQNAFPNWGMAYYPMDKRYSNQFELEQFRKNISILASLSPVQNVTSILFWKRVEMYIRLSSNQQSIHVNTQLEQSIGMDVSRIIALGNND